MDPLTCLHLAKVSFRHPASGTTTVLTARAPEVFPRIVAGEPDVYRPLHAALVRRLSFVVQRDINAYRLLTGDVEDLKGLVVERFGVVAVLQVSADRPALTRFLPQIGQWYCRCYPHRGVGWLHRGHHRCKRRRMASHRFRLGKHWCPDDSGRRDVC